MAPSEPSPVSDESSSEGPYLHVVKDTIAHDQPTVMSPRSALLAHTSLREHSAEPITTIIESSRTRKRNSASERRRKRERDLANASPSQRELVRLLIDQEQEASTLRKQLHIANQRVDFEAKRAAELEQANQQVTQRYREINESKVVVQQEATRAIQDSRVSHLELENAQKEIERARESLTRIEKERDEAEAATARARAKARKLREQQILAAAREEGRRLGFEAGFEHARQERLSIAARPHGAALRRNPRLRNRDIATRPHSPADNAAGRKSPSSNKDVVNSPAESASRQNPLSSSRDVTRPYFPPAPYQDSIRSNPQEQDEVALRRSRVLDDLDASPEMSVSDLPIRNLPPIDPAVNSPAVSGSLPRTPLRSFQPPPESTFGSRPPTPTPPASSPTTIQAQEAPSQLADRSPPIQFFSIDIPPQEELSRAEFEREFNTKENPNDIIKRIPPEGWVTAAKHREIQGSPPAPYPGPQPPPLLPAQYPQPQPQPKNVRLAKPVPKAVRFPSLAKTKQQAVSWYRSLSLRRRNRNRPVIDPVDDAGISAQNQSTTPTSATNNKGKAPEPNSAFTESSDDSQYGVPPRPSQSWYKKSAPSSIYNTDGKRRPISGVESSPGLSQFELLFTPHVGTSSVKSGKEGKKLKEKDSQLSVIKEETPTNDRFLPNASSSKKASSSTIPRPNFIGLEQKGSRETLGSSSSPMKRQHPLAIVVPAPEEPLPQPGVVYSQSGPSNWQPHDYPVLQKGSQSSGKTSIAIEVVPPSGFAPDFVHSPPHTERNHLSPYHVFRPTSQPSSSRIIPMASITSLQGLSDDDLGPPPPLPIKSRSGSRASSRRADNGGLESSRPRSAASRPQSAMSATPYNNPAVNKSVEDARSSHSHTPRAPTTPTMMPRETQSSPRPKSAQSSASKNQLSVLNLNASQTNIVGRQQSSQHPSSSTLNLVPPVHHSTSRVSLREAGSFSNGFDDGTYLDPAYFPAAVGSHLDSRPVSRGTSSVLSYA